MWPYWIMYLLPVMGVLSSADLKARRSGVGWGLVVFLFAVLVGLRDRVGGDWVNYKVMFTRIQHAKLDELFAYGDPGYTLLNVIAGETGGGIYTINMVCGLFFVYGMAYFAKRQPLPWVALAVSVPYLMIVVGMGYTRQAVALGFALVGLAELAKDSRKRFVFWVLMGALFHKSAVLLLPIGALSATQNRLWTYFWIGMTATIGAYALLLDTAQDLWTNYVEARYQSQGGLIRVLMNVVPSVILILCRDRIFRNPVERKLWMWMAMLSLISLPLVGLASTAVDRVALYFIPIQLFTFSRLPMLANSMSGYQTIVGGILIYYLAVMIVWLNFAAHAKYWLPYSNFLWS